MKFSLVLLMFLFAMTARTQTYPFNLPENFTATLNVDSQEEEVFNNLLLGVNIHDLAHAEGQELVRDFDPITIRFPHGLFANWYDWEQDKARLYGEEKVTYTRADGSTRTVEISYLSSIKIMDSKNLYVGIDGLNGLNNERKAARGEGYDMMWTFNMSADGTDFNNGSPVSVARYKDLIARGFQVKAIEMGNENFYAGQRSSIIPNHSDYIARAKDMYKALKALDPDLKLSVNLERKSNPANTGWNTDLTKDGTDYFDAVSVHTYVGYDPDDNSNSNEAYSVALTAREVLRKTIDDYSKVVAPDKPIWLTEWGVRSGGPNAVSALGAADCYMFMSEHQDTYERANWFSVNGKLNSHLVWETVNGKEVKKQPLEKTSYGSLYEIVRSVYENSTMLGSSMEVPKLDGVVNAVNARAVKKDGKTLIFVLNMTDRQVPFVINMDGQRFFGEFEHKTFAFSSMDDEISLPYHQDPLELVKEGRGNIYLPKLSMNVIELKNDDVMPLEFVGLHNQDVIDKGSNLEVEVKVGDAFKSLALYVNDSLLSTKTEAPYTWSGFPQLINMIDASYTFKLVGQMQNDELVEHSITLTTPEQWAFTEGYRPHSIPGIINAASYDYGGENVAFYDKSVQNPASYNYRGSDKVDLSKDGNGVKYLQGNEWLEYTVEVERSGTYDLAVKHQTRRSPAFEAFTMSFEDAGDLFSKVVCTNTGSSATAVDTFSSAYLEKGRHILRLGIDGYGWDLDYFEFILTSNPIDYINVGTLANPINPQSYDKGKAVSVLASPLDSLGFDFGGWFTNAAFSDTVTVPAISDTDDMAKVFYAKWQPQVLKGEVLVYGDVLEGETLRVDTTYIQNNSGALMYQWQVLEGESFTDIVGAQSPRFVITPDVVGKQLRVVVTSSLQTGELTSAASNAVLAQGANTYTITYDANGGEDGEQSSERVGYGGFPTFVARPVREGYTVAVWTNAQGDTLSANSVIVSDTTLYAKWEVNIRYKVSFVLNDSVIDLMTDNYPATLPFMPEEPSQADSTFEGWFTANDEPFDTTNLVFEDLKIYPLWEVKRFPIEVVSNGGNVIFEPSASSYPIHTEVKLIAVPSSRNAFVNWTGDLQSTDSIITVTVDSTIHLTANYQSLPYYSLYVFSMGNGTVSQTPNQSYYISGTDVQITATPSSNYEFDTWSGDYEGNENPLTITLKNNMFIYANFKPIAAGVNEVSDVVLQVYPNPSTSGVFKFNKYSDYELYSVSGTRVMFGEGESLDISMYPKGMYFLKLSSSIHRIVYK